MTKSSDPINHYCSLISEQINEFHGAKPIADRKHLDTFTAAFVEAFLVDVNENEKERSREEREDGLTLHLMDYELEDIDPRTLQKIIKDCKKFQSEHEEAITNGGINFDDPYEQAGYDFYFTRCGHGVGFWETDDWPEPYSKELTAAAKKFGNVDGYVGDDNKVYIMGAEGDWTAGGMIKGVNVPKEETPYSDGYEDAESDDDGDDDEDVRGLSEGGSKLKRGEEHAGITDDMSGRWTIRAFDTKKTNKDETPVIKEGTPEPQPILGVDDKLVAICAWCDKDKKITKQFRQGGYDTTHGICKHCFELMKMDLKESGIIKLKSLLELDNEYDENPTWPDVGDVDKDFEPGETNFPHGSGHPNVKKDYNKVVQMDSIYGVDDADVHKYNTNYAPKIIQYVNQHLPWVKGYFKEDSYLDNTEVWGAESDVRRVLNNFKHWATEKEENVFRQGAPEWWSQMYKRAQHIVQEFPNVMRDIEKYERFLEFIHDESPDNVENQKNYPLHVTLYDVTRALGGHEEGGWWYDNNDMIKTIKVTNFAQAEKAAKLLYSEIQKADLDGQPRIVIEKKPGGESKDAPRYS